MKAAFGGLVVLLALVAAASGAALVFFSRGRPPEASRSVLPPEPRLQADAAGDLRRFRAEEDAELGSYGWEDRSRGTIRIPIDRAMKLLLRRGLPTRPASARPVP